MRLLLAALPLCLMLGAAHAEWKAEYANQPQEIRDWYRNAELTEAAQARFGFKSCCAHSDRVLTRFRPLGRDDGWEFVDEHNQWSRVPQDIIHTDKFAPGGEPIMFAVGGRPTCFFPPQGGI